MVNQTAISLKIDTGQLQRLDALCSELGCKRNNLINFFIKQGNELLGEHKKCLLTSIYHDCLIEFNK